MQRRRHRLERPFRLVKETVDEIRRVFAVLTPDDAYTFYLRYVEYSYCRDVYQSFWTIS